MKLQLNKIFHTDDLGVLETSNDRLILINNSDSIHADILFKQFRQYLHTNNKQVLAIDFLGGHNMEYQFLCGVKNFLDTHPHDEVFIVIHPYQSLSENYTKLPQLLPFFIENRRVRILARTNQVSNLPVGLLNFATILTYSSAKDFNEIISQKGLEREVSLFNKSDFIFQNNSQLGVCLVHNPFSN